MPLFKIEEYINELVKKTYIVKAKTKAIALSEFRTFCTEYVGTDNHLQTQQQQVIVTPISNQQAKTIRGKYGRSKKSKWWY